MAVPVYLGLVHYPVYNKHGQVITTAITNFDIHDIARTARTYGLRRYFIIHPHPSQARLAQEIVSYWQEGYGAAYNPDRREAFSILTVVPSIETAVEEIALREGVPPLVVTTDARKYPNTVSYAALRQMIQQLERPLLILYGTGWGMEKTLMEGFDYILEPVYGAGDYNHLPVRAAVAIILDRLCGEKWWQT